MPILIPQEDAPFRSWPDRLVATLFVTAAVVVMSLLAPLQPDARGYGTHEQLGMAPCSWPMGDGLPCPTCGVTTAATHVVQLNPLAAVQAHPFGAVMAMFGLFLAVMGAICLIRSRSFLSFLVTLPVGKVMLSGLVLLLASWGYKYLVHSTG